MGARGPIVHHGTGVVKKGVHTSRAVLRPMATISGRDLSETKWWTSVCSSGCSVSGVTSSWHACTAVTAVCKGDELRRRRCGGAAATRRTSCLIRQVGTRLYEVREDERDLALMRLHVSLDEGVEVWEEQPVCADQTREEIDYHEPNLWHQDTRQVVTRGRSRMRRRVRGGNSRWAR